MEKGEPSPPVNRRSFVESTAMVGGLVAGYGALAIMSARFLHARDDGAVAWQYLCRLNELAVGESMTYTTPIGAQVVVARQKEGDTADAFVALSSICPHLGCQVHWEPQNDRFFCPCHNGAFDASGQPTEGPPATAGQELTRFPLQVMNGLLFIQVPMQSVNGAGQSVAAAKHSDDDGPSGEVLA